MLIPHVKIINIFLKYALFIRVMYKVCLEVILSKTKIIIYGHNKRKLNQEEFYLNKDQIEISHEYKYLGMYFYLHGYFEPSSKRQRITSMKPLMGIFEERSNIGSHMLGTKIPSIQDFGASNFHIWH